jgi:hypothetical protein
MTAPEGLGLWILVTNAGLLLAASLMQTFSSFRPTSFSEASRQVRFMLTGMQGAIPAARLRTRHDQGGICASFSKGKGSDFGNLGLMGKKGSQMDLDLHG